MSDARFEDGAERALRLRAESEEDLPVLSALVQDAVCETSRISWLRKHRRLSLLLNRFRWEDAAAAKRQARPFERVQSLLVIDNVLRVRANGVDPADRDLVVSLLSLAFEAGEEGAGTLRLLLAGDGEIAVEVECLDVLVADVSRPYIAHSRTAPQHRET